jgi:antitoxin (DNA-binding transcriptional repressor) of toxin-antitoxin stability system
METINVRDLQRNFKKISAKVQNGESLIVLKNANPIFRIDPIGKKIDKDKFMEKIKTIQFESDHDLSEKLDKTIYEK